MSEIVEISDDENDSAENTITEDEETPVKHEINSKEAQNTVNTSIHSNGVSSGANYKKQKLIKQLFPTLKNVPTKPEHKKPKQLFVRPIAGVKVKLPVNPYGCQVALMANIITRIKKSENALLESPTGTGKTLAILCATLAWQQHEMEQKRAMNELLGGSVAKENNPSGLESPLKKMQNLTTSTTPEKIFTKPVFGEKSIYDPVQDTGECSNNNMKRKWEERGSPSGKLHSEPGLVTIHKKATLDPNVIDLTEHPGLSSPTPGPSKPLQGTNNEETLQSKRIPTIYYGSRTHKQLEQVIKEFTATHYCGETTMAILSSREYSCIRPFDRQQWTSKDEMCRGCTKNHQPTVNQASLTNCKYYENRSALDHDQLPPSFNLEQLVEAGRDHAACPYYAGRVLATRANIVFCPYNYLIDPGIRKNMQINVKDNIIIIDEAHNIEDVCRDAATFVVNLKQLDDAFKELSVAATYKFANSSATYLESLKSALDKWCYWFRNQIPLVEQAPMQYGKAVFTWSDIRTFAATLDNHDIGAAQYPQFSKCVQQMSQQFMDDPRSLIGVTQSTSSLLGAMDAILGYLFGNSGEFMDDFVAALIKKESESKKECAVTLHVMCMRAGVVFGALRPARTILLASGTLPPKELVAAELGAAFHALSLSHVVPPHQVWAGAVAAGPGATLALGWRDARRGDVQDALGRTLLRAARLAPHGVLCFLPSYRLLRDLRRRWEQSDIWKSLNEAKYVYIESQNTSEHNDIMKLYYEKVSTAKGALLIGVYRGKAAEGMDFRDHQARLVVAVGIPYPNLDDVAVREKKRYNDRNIARGMQSGDAWYHAQAYRALSQALGRCVRHAADWGAALLLGERYAEPRALRPLPAWLRDPLMNKTPYTYDGLVQGEDSLKTFMENMTNQMETEEC